MIACANNCPGLGWPQQSATLGPLPSWCPKGAASRRSASRSKRAVPLHRVRTCPRPVRQPGAWLMPALPPAPQPRGHRVLPQSVVRDEHAAGKPRHGADSRNLRRTIERRWSARPEGYCRRRGRGPLPTTEAAALSPRFSEFIGVDVDYTRIFSRTSPGQGFCGPMRSSSGCSEGGEPFQRPVLAPGDTPNTASGFRPRPLATPLQLPAGV